jgi:hypothetical protein
VRGIIYVFTIIRLLITAIFGLRMDKRGVTGQAAMTELMLNATLFNDHISNHNCKEPCGRQPVR